MNVSKYSRHFLTAFLSAAFFGLSGGVAQGEFVRMDVTGHMTEVVCPDPGGCPSWQLEVGDPVTLSWVYDTEVAATWDQSYSLVSHQFEYDAVRPLNPTLGASVIFGPYSVANALPGPAADPRFLAFVLDVLHPSYTYSGALGFSGLLEDANEAIVFRLQQNPSYAVVMDGPPGSSALELASMNLSFFNERDDAQRFLNSGSLPSGFQSWNWAEKWIAIEVYDPTSGRVGEAYFEVDGIVTSVVEEVPSIKPVVDLIQITDTSGRKSSPAISGSNVVWQRCYASWDDFRNRCENGRGEIEFWDGSFPINPIRVTNNNKNDGSPDISGSNVVWTRWDGNDNEIYFWDGSFPINPIQITDNDTNDYEPAISGSNVVWTRTDGDDNEIYFWDGSFPINPIQVTDNDTNDSFPAISGSNVVWQGWNGSAFDFNDNEIYFWDGSFPVNAIQITDDDAMDYSPAISDSTVVWRRVVENVDPSRAAYWTISRWDGSFPVVLTVVPASAGGFLSEASGSNVAWVEMQSSAFSGDRWGWDVFFSDGMITTTVSETSSSGPATGSPPFGRLRNSDPDISGTRVVWWSCPYLFEADYGADICTEQAQIYMATVSIPTPVPLMPLAGLAILSSLLIGTVFLIRFREYS